MAEILIKNGSVEISAKHSDLIEVQETADGVVFNFKGGISVFKNDQYMASSTKQLIKNTADNFPSHKLIFELDNPKTPARVDST